MDHLPILPINRILRPHIATSSNHVSSSSMAKNDVMNNICGWLERCDSLRNRYFS
jgi:hypothetical protein